MGIFKNITKTLKKAAPIIGGTIGFMVGGPAYAALGSGIGSLAAGRSTEEALMSAALGFGVGSLGQSMGYGPTAAKLTNVAAPVSGAAYGPETLIPQISKTAAPTSFLDKAIGFAKTPTGIATIGGLGALALGGLDEEESDWTIKMLQSQKAVEELLRASQHPPASGGLQGSDIERFEIWRKKISRLLDKFSYGEEVEDQEEVRLGNTTNDRFRHLRP